MQPITPKTSYLEELRKRKKESHAYSAHQLAGLEIADILGDRPHKSLYIKLAKQHGVERMMRIAKTVADKEGVKNRGAYFMHMISADTTPSQKKKTK